MARKVCVMAGCFMMVAAIEGCGSKYPDMGRVSGKVTYKGSPVTKGIINYLPEDAQQRVAHGGDPGRIHQCAIEKDLRGGNEIRSRQIDIQEQRALRGVGGADAVQRGVGGGDNVRQGRGRSARVHG